MLLGAFAGPPVLDASPASCPGRAPARSTGAILVLAAPAAVLAAVSPIALHAVLTAGAVGRDAGRVYAAGTAGSVAGSLGAAFWLVELAGLRGLLAGCAAVLVACAAAGLLVRSERRAGWLLLIGGVPAVALVSAALHAASSGASEDGVRERVETGELSVAVVDDGPIRRLLFPGDLIQSEQDTRAPGRLRLGYTHAVHGATCRARAAPAGAADRRRRRLARPLRAPRRARRADRRGRAAPAGPRPRPPLVRPPGGPWVAYHVDDGRRYLGRERDRYDLIVLDAFGTARVPPHLLSREFMALARERLAPGGVLAANVIAGARLRARRGGAGDRHRRLRLRRRPARRSPPPGTWSGRRPPPRRGRGCQEEQALALGLPAAAVAGAPAEVAGGRVLTDDHNPADSLSRD